VEFGPTIFFQAVSDFLSGSHSRSSQSSSRAEYGVICVYPGVGYILAVDGGMVLGEIRFSQIVVESPRF